MELPFYKPVRGGSEVITQIATADSAVMVGKRRLTLSPAIVATIVVAEQTFTCPGVPANAAVFVSKPTINGAIGTCQARRSAANQIAISFVNPTAGGITPTAGEVYEVFYVVEAPTA